MKIKYLSDYPFSIGFGGKEIQLLTYSGIYAQNAKFSASILDYFNKDELEDCHALHIFGYSTWYRSLIKNLKNKKPKIKIICSPNFYRNDAIKYGIALKFFRKFPVRNYFSELDEIFSSVDGIIFNSYEELDQHRTIFGASKCATVIHNGIPDDFAKTLLGIEKKLNIDLPPKYLLSVGFFDERKNTNTLLKAFMNEFKNEEVKLLLVGAPRFASNSEYAKFKMLISQSNGRVSDLGFIPPISDELKTLYANCRAHVLPSLFETPGISTLEALAFGKPVVAGECAPVREYLGGLPFYCNPKSISSVQSAIRRAYETNETFELPTGLYYSSLGNKLNEFYLHLIGST